MSRTTRPGRSLRATSSDATVSVGTGSEEIRRPGPYKPAGMKAGRVPGSDLAAPRGRGSAPVESAHSSGHSRSERHVETVSASQPASPRRRTPRRYSAARSRPERSRRRPPVPRRPMAKPPVRSPRAPVRRVSAPDPPRGPPGFTGPVRSRKLSDGAVVGYNRKEVLLADGQPSPQALSLSPARVR